MYHNIPRSIDVESLRDMRNTLMWQMMTTWRKPLFSPQGKSISIEEASLSTFYTLAEGLILIDGEY